MLPRWATFLAVCSIPVATYSWVIWRRPNIYEQIQEVRGELRRVRQRAQSPPRVLTLLSPVCLQALNSYDSCDEGDHAQRRVGLNNRYLRSSAAWHVKTLTCTPPAMTLQEIQRQEERDKAAGKI